MKNCIIFNASFLACTTILASGVFAADNNFALSKGNQAVSAPNATVDFASGIMDGNGTGSIAAVGDIPLGDKYGLQLDTLYRKSGDIDAGGVAGHAFYRDPEAYLLGLTSLWSNVEGENVYRYGVESEIYLHDVTLAPSFGIQRGDLNNGNVGYYDMDASYYVTDNLKLTGNLSGFPSAHGGYGEVEWKPDASAPLSLYATVGDSNVNKTYGMVGIRISFGGSGGTLKHRDRYDDPKNIVRTFDQHGFSDVNDDHPHPTPTPSAG